MVSPLDAKTLTDLAKHLDGLFALGSIQNLTLLHGSYVCQNFDVACDRGRFFLKQYRHRLSHRVSEIKISELYFAKQGMPVVLPIKDRYGRNTFWFHGSWYSLFPFINASPPKISDLSLPALGSLAVLMAKMHNAGKQAGNFAGFSELELWSSDAFEMEYVELEQAILNLVNPTDIELAMLENLRLKKRLIRQNPLKPSDFPLKNNCLLHGDLIYQNTFISPAGQVTHLYDFEKTCLGPRAYELARSLLINCFDNGFAAENFARAEFFLSAYQKNCPIDFDEFLAGLKMHQTQITHLTWMEAKYLLMGSSDYLPVYYSNLERIRHLTGRELDFARRVFV